MPDCKQMDYSSLVFEILKEEQYSVQLLFSLQVAYLGKVLDERDQIWNSNFYLARMDPRRCEYL